MPLIGLILVYFELRLIDELIRFNIGLTVDFVIDLQLLLLKEMSE